MKSTGTSEGNTPLKWDLFVTPGIPMVSNDLAPGEKRRMWSPISATLIYGKRDAVLVDTFITVDQADVLVEWVKGSGKNLTTIYITHGHGSAEGGIRTHTQAQFPKTLSEFKRWIGHKHSKPRV